MGHVHFLQKITYSCIDFSKLHSTLWTDYPPALFQLTKASKVQLTTIFSFSIPILHLASKSTLHRTV